MNRARQLLLISFIASCLSIASPASAAEPKQSTPQKLEIGRFLPIPPPAAGDKTYANFLWVLDTATGYVAAYRMASMKNDKGEHGLWVTERLLSEAEYYQLMSKQEQ